MPRLWGYGQNLRQHWDIRRVPVLLRTGVDLMIQVKQDGWTFTVVNGRDLTINGEGITRVYKVQDMRASEVEGFALGWVAHVKMLRADSTVEQDRYPVYAPM